MTIFTTVSGENPGSTKHILQLDFNELLREYWVFLLDTVVRIATLLKKIFFEEKEIRLKEQMLMATKMKT